MKKSCLIGLILIGLISLSISNEQKIDCLGHLIDYTGNVKNLNFHCEKINKLSLDYNVELYIRYVEDIDSDVNEENEEWFKKLNQTKLIAITLYKNKNAIRMSKSSDLPNLEFDLLKKNLDSLILENKTIRSYTIENFFFYSTNFVYNKVKELSEKAKYYDGDFIKGSLNNSFKKKSPLFVFGCILGPVLLVAIISYIVYRYIKRGKKNDDELLADANAINL